MKYRCWKYCHLPMLHTMSLAGVVANDMYLEVAEGKLNQTWKDKNSVDFWTFRDLLSNQMVKYNPTHLKYSVDANIIPDTQHI